jgi:hypothetical protein
MLPEQRLLCPLVHLFKLLSHCRYRCRCKNRCAGLLLLLL